MLFGSEALLHPFPSPYEKDFIKYVVVCVYIFNPYISIYIFFF